MSETQITRCPHCQTSFRIRTEQLSAAKGAVRCGSCLQVFKAAEHIVTNQPVKPAVESAPEQKPETEISFDDIPDQIQDDPLEDFGIRQPNARESDSEESFNSGLQLDESIFDIGDSSDTSSIGSNAGFEFTVEANFSSFDSNKKNDESWTAGLSNEDSSFTEFHGDNDESWAEDLLVDDELINDIESDYAITPPKPEKDDFVPSLEGPQDDDDQFHLGGNDLVEEEIELSAPTTISHLQDEPLALNKKTTASNSTRANYSFPWFWFSASVLMVLVMIAQIGYFKFDTWSRHPDYRPFYTIACEALECKLPAVQDVSKMNTQHFMVRPHPDVNQALYIDTLLINNAAYNQPFPDLQLIFTGLEDQVIASRSFKPKEYLAGELAGATVMPQKVPIHIAFEIVNPSVEAVSYQIKLMANH